MKKLELNNAGISELMHGQKTSPINRSWGFVVLIASIAFAAILWMTGSKQNPTVIPQQSILQETTVQGSVLPINALAGFISEANNSDLPKNFSSEFINFKKGSSKILPGGDKEIDQMSLGLENSPFATIRIEGFPDNEGDLTQKKDLAFKRALAVKEQIVMKGINPDRIDTVGNTSGNQKIIIVVTSVE